MSQIMTTTDLPDVTIVTDPRQFRGRHLPPSMWATVDAFHDLYHGVAPWPTWLGVPILKCPMDLMIYQELLWRVKPDTIIETGTCAGGSALFFASMLDVIGHGHVLTIDSETEMDTLSRWALQHRPKQPWPVTRPEHPRITYLAGHSTTPKIIEAVTSAAQGTIFVSLDSFHMADLVYAECCAYGPLVTPGSYLVIEDVNVNGKPVSALMGQPGPFEAAMEWLGTHPEFAWNQRIVDQYLFSYNGWLLRLKDQDA